MSTISDKLNQVSMDKDAIRLAIEDKKGATLNTPNDFSTYSTEIANLGLGEEDLTLWNTGTYENNVTLTKYLRIVDATDITISIVGEVEDGFDFIKIYDVDNVELGSFTGVIDTKLHFVGNTIKAVLTSNAVGVTSGVIVSIVRGNTLEYIGTTADGNLNFTDISEGYIKTNLLDVTGGVKSNSTTAIWKAEPKTQEVADEDWLSTSDTSLSITPSEVIVEDTSTNTELISFNPFVTDSKLVLIKDDNTFVEGQIGVVTVQDIPLSIVSNTSPFGDDSLLLKWEFNGNFTDTTGDHDGTNTNVGFDSNGTFNSSCGVFSNGNSFVKSSLYLNAGMTISFFFKDGFAISNEDTTNVSNRISVYGTINTNGRITVRSRSRNGTHGSGSYFYRKVRIKGFDPTIFNHVVIRINALNDYGLFINGVEHEFTVDAQSGSLATPQGHFTVGRYDYNGTTYYKNGLIDQVEVYSRILTEAEINMLYVQQAPVPIYSADITSYNLVDPPSKVYNELAIQPSFSVESGAREVLEDITLTITDSTLTYITVAEDISNIVVVGDVLKLDNDIVQISSIVGSQYHFNNVLVAPTTAVIPARLIKPTIKTKTFDGTKFNLVYNDMTSINTRSIRQLVFFTAENLTLHDNLNTALFAGSYG